MRKFLNVPRFTDAYIIPHKNDMANREAVNRAASLEMLKVSREYITMESLAPMPMKINAGRSNFQMSVFVFLSECLYVHRNIEVTASIIAIIFVVATCSPYINIENSIGTTSDILLATVVITMPVLREEIPTRKKVAIKYMHKKYLYENVN